MHHLTLSFLGPFQASLDDKPLTTFRSAKVQGLLIYLALTAPQAHEREVLATFFWPEDRSEIAKRNLRQSLYRLRRVLGDLGAEAGAASPPFLLITRSTVQLNPASSHTLDVTDFYAAVANGDLETAVSLYRDSLLDGFYCDSLPFDEWLRAERAGLHRRVLDVLNQLTTYSLTHADFQRAESLARRQLRLEPWREAGHRQLMQALALQGERSVALTQYETCRAVLDEELGIEPSVETKRLAERIRDLDLPQPGSGDESIQRFETPFVGRQSEYEQMVQAYRQIAAGPQIVTVLGKAGIGKTRLTHHFLEWGATQGADVLVGRAFENSAGLSYRPLTDLLRQRLERENAPEDLLSDFWLSQLTRILPELRERYPDLPDPIQEEEAARQHLFEAIARLGQGLAQRRPLLLFIDDWHWADSASLDLLHYVTQRWAEEKTPVLILLTLRQEVLTDSDALQSWLDQIKRSTAATQLSLESLSRSETDRLLQTLLKPNGGSDDHTPAGFEDGPNADQSDLSLFASWLFRETEGQPLFLAEALKVLAQEKVIRPPSTSSGQAHSTSLKQAASASSGQAASAGSGQARWELDWARFDAQQTGSRLLAGVQEIIQGWLARISSPASDLLTATAVLGQSATFDLLCQVAGIDEMEALTALDELLKRQLLLEGEPTAAMAYDPLYTFSHYKISEVVYAAAGSARRRLQHRRAFQALQAGPAPAAECAKHALQAGLWAETIRYSLMAGNDAIGLFAHRLAITHFETAWRVAEQQGWPEAISGADRQELYTSLGRAYDSIADWPKARETFEAMIAYAREIGAPALECQGLNQLANTYSTGLKNPQKAFELLEEARRVAEQSGDLRGMAETECNVAFTAIFTQQIPLGLEHAERALPLARQLGHPDLLARVLQAENMCHAIFRRWEKAAAGARETSQIFLSAGNRMMAANVQSGVGFCMVMYGQPRESLEVLEEAFAVSQQIENTWIEGESARILAFAQQELGHYDQAIRLARHGLEKTEIAGVPRITMLAKVTWGMIQRYLFALDSALAICLAVYAESKAEAMLGWITEWACAELSALYALLGDWEQAADYAKQTLQAVGESPLLPWGRTFWYDVEALLRSGDEALARAEVERISGIVGSNRRYKLPLLRSQAVLARWDGEIGQAITHLEAALALAHEIGLPGEAWPILSELSGLYREQGEQENAKQAYREAKIIINRLAETIDDEPLKNGFLTANAVQSIFKMAEQHKQ